MLVLHKLGEACFTVHERNWTELNWTDYYSDTVVRVIGLDSRFCFPLKLLNERWTLFFPFIVFQQIFDLKLFVFIVFCYFVVNFELTIFPLLHVLLFLSVVLPCTLHLSLMRNYCKSMLCTPMELLTGWQFHRSVNASPLLFPIIGRKRKWVFVLHFSDSILRGKGTDSRYMCSSLYLESPLWTLQWCNVNEP